MWWRIAGITGALAVILGAFGAHALKQVVADPHLLEVWDTAARYHLVHAVAQIQRGGILRIFGKGKISITFDPAFQKRDGFQFLEDGVEVLPPDLGSQRLARRFKLSQRLLQFRENFF